MVPGSCKPDSCRQRCTRVCILSETHAEPRRAGSTGVCSARSHQTTPMPAELQSGGCSFNCRSDTYAEPGGGIQAAKGGTAPCGKAGRANRQPDGKQTRVTIRPADGWFVVIPVGRFGDFVLNDRKYFGRRDAQTRMRRRGLSVRCPRTSRGSSRKDRIFNCAAGPGSDDNGDRSKFDRWMQTPDLRVKSANLLLRPIKA